MKTLLFATVLCCSLAACTNNHPPTYTQYKPVLLARESLEKSIVFHAPVKILSPAKIYFKDNYIFISEHLKGVHIIDNINPKSPINKGYISVPGCVDMAIKDNVMYVDNATDLVALDLNSLTQAEVKITKRIKDVLPELPTPDGNPVPEKYKAENRPTDAVLVGWIK